MKKSRFLAIFLILAMALSILTSCDIIFGSTGDNVTDSEGSGDTPGSTTDGDTSDTKPDDTKPNDTQCEHSWTDPTCTEDGHCSKCNEIGETAKGHSFIEGSCSKCGETDPNYNPPHEHNFVEGKCECGETDPNYNPPHEHNFVDGKCECGESDPNYVPPECKHEWSDGVCLNCKEACSHIFSGDTCEICGFINKIDPPVDDCVHAWADGVCGACGKACEHDFDPKNDYTCTVCGLQAIVPPECNHEWVDGVCTLCGKVCEHDFGYDITCSICGELLSGSYILLRYNGTDYEVRYESTLAEFISEHLGTTYEDTVANGSYWMTVDLNLDKVTLEADTYLNRFGASLELYYIDCTPSPDCDHDWVDGYCIKCNDSCNHKWSDSVCTICGKACEHSWWTPGGCGDCGYPCEHVWNSEHRCDRCNMDCPHEDIAQLGYCSECSYECQHSWNLTDCEYCGFHCDHTFDGHTCTKCGYSSGGIDNPIQVTYNGQDYYVPYSAFFSDCFYMADLGFGDYQESITHGYWVVVTDQGDVEINEYTALCDFGHFVTIAFRTYGMDECYHLYWNDGYCASCGYACQHGAFLEGVCGICGMECAHRWMLNDWSAYCEICYMECHHRFNGDICEICGYESIPEYVDLHITLFYWTIPTDINPDLWDGGATEMQIYYDKLPLRAGQERYNTLANLINEYKSWNPYLADFDFNWYVDNIQLNDDDLIRNYAQLIAVDKNGPSDLDSTVHFSVPLMGIDHYYTYPCPVYIYDVCERFEKEFNIDRNLYYMDYSDETIDGLVIDRADVYYRMSERTLRVYLITDDGIECLSELRYLANEYPTYARLLSDTGINPTNYLTIDYYGSELTLDSDANSNVYLLEKSMVDDEIEIRISYTGEYNPYPITGTLTLTNIITLDSLWGMDMLCDDGTYFTIPYMYDSLIVVDGSSNTNFIYKDCAVVITPCYTVTVDLYNPVTQEYLYETFIFDHQPCGGDVMAKLGMDLSNYTVYANFSQYTPSEFDGLILEIHQSTVSFIANKVILDFYFVDENGYEGRDRCEYDINADLGKLLAEYGEGCELTVTYPDGTVKTIAYGESLTVSYDPDYSVSEYNCRATVYKVVVNSPYFTLKIEVDGNYKTIQLENNNELTLAEILESYLGLDYSNYGWNCMSDGSISLSADYVPKKVMEISGYDIRPHLTLRIDHVEYKIHHTGALSLNDAIDLVNEKYGTEFTYAGYTWYVYKIYREEYITDPSTIVINEGETDSVSARSINEITVYFNSDLGFVDENGYTGTVFTKDGEWSAPTVGSHITDMAMGIITFTGEFEYRIYDDNGNVVERRIISSIDDLLAIGLEEVTLYAEYEINYESICGTYVVAGEMFVITESTITLYSSSNNYIGEPKSYHVEVNYGIYYTNEDRDFHYNADYFGEYNRVDDDDLCIVLLRPDGYADLYGSYDYYLEVISNYNVDSVTDINGNYLGSVGETGVYIVRTSERTDYEWRDGYLYFGEYPQSLKADDVIITEVQNEKGYYLGSDGEWYLKHVATTYSDSPHYRFSNKEYIVPGQEYYFKIEPIRWVVLKNEDNTYSLVCADILMSGAFNSKVDTTSYLGSEVREWLTNEFYYSAFSSTQQSMLLDTYVGCTDNAGNYVYDYVYLLSRAQASEIAQEDRVRFATDFARANGLAYDTNQNNYDSFGSAMWWLLSTDGSSWISTVGQGGNISRWHVYDPWHAYVPAITVTIN